MLFKLCTATSPASKGRITICTRGIVLYISPNSSFNLVPTPEPVPPAALDIILKPYK